MEEIRDKIYKTSSIDKAIENFASKNHTSADDCDFKIRELFTYIKTNADEEFNLTNEDIDELYKNESTIISNRLELQQHYTVVVFKQRKVDIRLDYTIEWDEMKTNPSLILHPDSFIPYRDTKAEDTYRLLLQEINKIKAQNKILIGLYDKKMIRTLKSLTKHIYRDAFKNKIKIPLFEGIVPIFTVASKLILWYNQKNKESKQQIIEVEKGELLVEYKKAVFGKSGFNSFGEFIKKENLKNEDDLRLKIDDNSIEIQEDENRKLYKSKVKGFVHHTNLEFSVQNRYKKRRLSRNEDSLSKDENNNIEVVISQNDTNKDSIGEGVQLTSESIHITGHVGASSMLETTNLQIDGATHLTSMQFARFAKINRHKGTLRCHDAKIKLLEGGVVHATNVEIEASLNGTVHAKNVTIGHVKSNLKVYATESITIRLVSGEDNLFKINYKDVPISLANIGFINADIEELKYLLEEAKLHDNSKVDDIKDKITMLKSEINTIKQSTLKAKVTIEKPLIGLNTINFTFDNDKSIIYKTASQSYEPFYIKTTEDKLTLLPVNKSISLD